MRGRLIRKFYPHLQKIDYITVLSLPLKFPLLFIKFYSEQDKLPKFEILKAGNLFCGTCEGGEITSGLNLFVYKKSICQQAGAFLFLIVAEERERFDINAFSEGRNFLVLMFLQRS